MTGPTRIWAAAEDPQRELQFGCVQCALENVDAPLSKVYVWGGTTYCIKHIKAAQP